MKQDYFRMTREKWEAEYVRGQWNYIKQLDELARYSVIVGYCCYFRPGGTILDIGCGEGILQERLSPCQYSRYVGIDICAEAIRRALPKQMKRPSSFGQMQARTIQRSGLTSLYSMSAYTILRIR